MTLILNQNPLLNSVPFPSLCNAESWFCFLAVLGAEASFRTHLDNESLQNWKNIRVTIP